MYTTFIKNRRSLFWKREIIILKLIVGLMFYFIVVMVEKDNNWIDIIRMSITFSEPSNSLVNEIKYFKVSQLIWAKSKMSTFGSVIGKFYRLFVGKYKLNNKTNLEIA